MRNELTAKIKMDAIRKLYQALMSVDVVPVVRCRKCYYKDEKRTMGEDTQWCRKHHMYVTADWFCADGDRK